MTTSKQQETGRQPILWYDHPAAEWTQALPLGNGRLGAMVFGDPIQERIALNEDTLWTGFPRDTCVPGASQRLEEVRRLLDQGKNLEAQAIIEENMLGCEGDAYLPLGDLLLHFEGQGPAEDYRRELRLAQGVFALSYRAGGTEYRREMFASAVHDVLVFRFTAHGEGRLCFQVSMDSPLRHQITLENGRLLMDGECPSDNEMNYNEEEDRRGVRFLSALEIRTDGRVEGTGDGLTVRDAEEAVLYLAVKTSFRGYDQLPLPGDGDYRRTCLTELDKLPQDYQTIREAHLRDFNALFDRVDFSLPEDPQRSALPTDQRLAAFQQDQEDPGLYTLLFHYGRYLLISSSREGTQPANLQGIWNAELRAPWKSNYTLNINVEMNYWSALVCNLAELQRPLLQLTKELAQWGRETARIHYGARGFTAHHNTDLWRKTTPVCGRTNHAYWNMGGVWLSWQMAEYYRFTRDRNFLQEEAYPVMKQAALFCLDQLREGADGFLRATPATSPENWFLLDGEPCAVASSVAMTNSMVRHLFLACVQAAEELMIDADFREELAAALAKLEPYRIGSHGQLLEWDQEYPETDPHHRHVSQLFGLYPGDDLLDSTHPELPEACRQTLNDRGDDGSGWSLSWKVSLWARLRDGDRALKLLQNQLRWVDAKTISYEGGGGSYPNLFDAHPPFQIDGNFGVAAGIAEMLLQSHQSCIRLLPALPASWKEGSVRGLMARGNIQVDMEWREGRLVQATFTARQDTRLYAAYGIRILEIPLKSGEPLTVDGSLQPLH